MQRFTNLKVWQRSHALALEIYRATAKFPLEERFGLTAQLRRAVLSVPTNMVEGSKRQGGQEYARFLNVSEGSLAEVEYLLIVSRDLAYLAEDLAKHLLGEVDEIARMLHALRMKILDNPQSPSVTSRKPEAGNGSSRPSPRSPVSNGRPPFRSQPTAKS